MKFIPVLLLLVLILSIWLLPSAAPVIGVGLLVFSLSLAIFAIYRKHRGSYREGKITRAAFLRNMCLDTFGILLAVVLAALLGRYAIQLVAQPISSELARPIAEIVIGLLVGLGVGILVNRIWGRFVKTSA